MTMTLIEMDGFLRGKCLPGDMKVNETNAEYLVRKFAEAEAQLTALTTELESVVAENAALKGFVKTCFRAAGDGASLDGADIQELGERLGLFGRETYQPVLHGYICGHEAGEDSVYVMKETPATDAFLAEVRASTLRDEATERDLFEEWVMDGICISKSTLEGLRTDDGYRNSTLSGKDYNGMWSQWKSIRAAQLRQEASQ